MTDSKMLTCAKLADEIIESAALATDSYFRGQDATKRSIRQDMENLRSLLRAYSAVASTVETHTITKADK